jgi:hypothetical protein
MSEAAPHLIGKRPYGEVFALVAAERALATGALAVVSLHVVDDSSLQPQPGTPAGDHLVSGLVPPTRSRGHGERRDGVRARSRRPVGPIGMTLFLAGVAWLELRPRRRKRDARGCKGHDGGG